MRNASVKEIAIFSLLIVLCLTMAASCKNLIMQDILELKVISFDSNGGSPVPSQQRLLKGQVVSKPDDPVRDKFLFDGWYVDNDTFAQGWDFRSVPVKDLTLYAKWISDKKPGAAIAQLTADGNPATLSVTVTAVLAGGTVQDIEYALNTDSSVPADGWQAENKFVLTADTLYHVFARSALNDSYNAGEPSSTQAAFYTVTFNPNGGGETPSSQTVFINKNADEPEHLLREGYDFAGWYTEPDCKNKWDFADKVTGKLTLYAGWGGSAAITLDIEQIKNGDVTQYPVNVTLSKTGNNKTQVITITGDYDGIEWKVAGVGAYAGEFVTGNGNSFTLDATNTKYGTLGGHTLMLTVKIDGNPYMVNIIFTIEE